MRGLIKWLAIIERASDKRTLVLETETHSNLGAIFSTVFRLVLGTSKVRWFGKGRAQRGFRWRAYIQTRPCDIAHTIFRVA